MVPNLQVWNAIVKVLRCCRPKKDINTSEGTCIIFSIIIIAIGKRPVGTASTSDGFSTLKQNTYELAPVMAREKPSLAESDTEPDYENASDKEKGIIYSQSYNHVINY